MLSPGCIVYLTFLVRTWRPTSINMNVMSWLTWYYLFYLFLSLFHDLSLVSWLMPFLWLSHLLTHFMNCALTVLTVLWYTSSCTVTVDCALLRTYCALTVLYCALLRSLTYMYILVDRRLYALWVYIQSRASLDTPACSTSSSNLFHLVWALPSLSGFVSKAHCLLSLGPIHLGTYIVPIATFGLFSHLQDSKSHPLGSKSHLRTPRVITSPLIPTHLSFGLQKSP